MSNKLSASLKSFCKFMGYGLAALLLAQITDKGLWGVDWFNTARLMANFAVIGILKALMTAWTVEG